MTIQEKVQGDPWRPLRSITRSAPVGLPWARRYPDSVKPDLFCAMIAA
jgi:hypothetical protein